MAKFSQSSLDKLQGVDQRLVDLFNRIVDKHCDCKVVYGLRTLEEQKALFAAKKTQTMNSRHLVGKAVDVVPYPVDWKDTKRFYYFAGIVVAVAKEMGIPLRWGGDWNSNDNLDDQKFFDLDHFEIPESDD